MLGSATLYEKSHPTRKALDRDLTLGSNALLTS